MNGACVVQVMAFLGFAQSFKYLFLNCSTRCFPPSVIIRFIFVCSQWTVKVLHNCRLQRTFIQCLYFVGWLGWLTWHSFLCFSFRFNRFLSAFGNIFRNFKKTLKIFLTENLMTYCTLLAVYLLLLSDVFIFSEIVFRPSRLGEVGWGNFCTELQKQ